MNAPYPPEKEGSRLRHGLGVILNRVPELPLEGLEPCLPPHAGLLPGPTLLADLGIQAPPDSPACCPDRGSCGPRELGLRLQLSRVAGERAGGGPPRGHTPGTLEGSRLTPTSQVGDKPSRQACSVGRESGEGEQDLPPAWYRRMN